MRLQTVADSVAATFFEQQCFQLCSLEVMEMKKTSLLMVLGLALVAASAAAPKANAGVVVGVQVGAPVYVHPARPYFYGPRVYVGPRYVAPQPYVRYVPAPLYPRAYVAPGPVYYRHWYPRGYVGRRDFYRHRR